MPTSGCRGDIRLEAQHRSTGEYLNDWIQLCSAFADAGNIWMTRPDPDSSDVEFNAATVLSQPGRRGVWRRDPA